MMGQGARFLIERGKDGYYHPSNEDDISEVVKYAVREGLKVRVRGSAHSVDAAIYTGDFRTPPLDDRDLNIYMDKMIDVEFDDEKMQATVQAGCHLGKDPEDPVKTSTIENSLFYQLDERGWAFPDTGGIIHQTVGGFLSTGSSGGSVQHSIGKQIVAMTLVDGTGRPGTLAKTDNEDNPFYAAGVSMGLLGIITSVTFQCVPRYDVIGKETTSKYEDCEIDLFGDGTSGRPSLETFLRETEHTRLMWWPQKGVRKMVVWRARSMRPSDYSDETGTPDSFTPKRYHEFPKILGSQRPAMVFASLLLRCFDRLNPPGPSSWLGKLINKLAAPVYSLIVSAFLGSSTQEFWESWREGLPMDNRVDYDLMPTAFTELWIPLSRTQDVMNKLRRHYEKSGFAATGIYTCEIYPTMSSDYWIGASYHEDVIKIDTFWFEKSKGNPDSDFFPQFWELLKEFDYRLHWGKSLSGDAAYLNPLYPRWDDFMRLRAEMDPHQVFVTDYWRKHLAIAATG